MLRFLLIVALWLASPVRACLIDFASLSTKGEIDIESLSVVAYGELLDKLAGNQLTADILDQMVKSKDPFSVPEGSQGLDGLQKHLQQLHEMLKDRETPALRKTLTAVLKARGKALRSAKAKVDHAVRSPPKDLFVRTDLSFEVVPLVDVDFYMLGTKASGNGQYPVARLDGKTGEFTPLSTTWERPVSPTLTPDGNFLLYGRSGARIRKIPVGPNGPEWAKAVEVGENQINDGSATGNFQFGDGPDGTKVMYATKGADDFPGVRFDLAAKIGTTVDWQRPYGNTRMPIDWGTLPNTDLLYSATILMDPKSIRAKQSTDGKIRVDLVRVDRNGVAEVVTSGVAEFPMKWGMVDWPNRDGAIFVSDQKRVMALLPGQTKPEVIFDKKTETIEETAVHPDGKSIAVLMSGLPTVFWIDAATKRVLAEVRLKLDPGGAPEMKFLPDGRLLVIGHGEVKAAIYDMEPRRSE